jgi:hypothetical protein
MSQWCAGMTPSTHPSSLPQDRFLSAAVVPLAELQTLGLACLFLASKLLETAPMRMRHIKKLFREIASPEQLRRAELLLVIRGLQWNLNAFTACSAFRILAALIGEADIQREVSERGAVFVRAAAQGEEGAGGER